MSFNNKLNRLAQAAPQPTASQPTVQQLATQAAGKKAVTELKENVPENVIEYGAKQGVQKFAPGLLKTVKPMPTGVKGLLAGGKGLAAGMVLQGGISLAEEMQGPKKIFNNYYPDYVKLLNALASEFPQNQELQNMVNLGKQIGQKSQQIMMSSNVQGPTIGQAIGTGISTGKEQALSYLDMGKAMMGMQQQPTNATYNHKMQRLAIVGEAEATRTMTEAGKGTLLGFAAGGNPLTALIGGAVGAATPIMQNIYHHTRSNEYQAAAYTNELKDKGMTLVSQLEKVDPVAAKALYNYVTTIDNYVKKNIYKGGGTAFEKGIDAVTKFFTREKDQDVNQDLVNAANEGADLSPEEYQQELSSVYNSLGSPSNPAPVNQNDQNISVGIEQLNDIYQEGMQYYNAGNTQQYNQIKLQYDQGVQTLTNYIAQKYPGSDPNAILKQYMGQGAQQTQPQLQQPQ